MARKTTSRTAASSSPPPRRGTGSTALVPQPGWPPKPHDQRVSVIIPVLNESARVASVIRLALVSPLVGEVIVLDDGSIDGTPEMAHAVGARVITSTLLGKGASMEDGLLQARHDTILYLDGDLAGLRDDLVGRMTEPVLRGEADFVKASFSRWSGRVTVLTARPLLRAYFPELTSFEQPLAGIIAVRNELLRRLRFENDYGVDIGLLIDSRALGGFDVRTFSAAATLWDAFQLRPARMVIMERRFGGGVSDLDLASSIRKHYLLPYTYIVALRTMSRLQEIKEGLAAGVDDYLIKPPNPLQVRSRVLVGLRWLQFIDSLYEGKA